MLPCHKNHAIAVLICRIQSPGIGNISAVYHARANSKLCTYRILLAKHRPLLYVSRVRVHIFPVTVAQLFLRIDVPYW
jgi:hypothetical protein